MTPQSGFMTAAPVRSGQVAALRELLKSMNLQPGVADPNSTLVPFGDFDTLHFARFVVLEDMTLDDLSAYHIQRPAPPVYLAFLADFDGDCNPFVERLVARAGSGLRRIFSFCEGFDAGTDLLTWIKAHEQKSPTYYCNWVGRTVLQCKEEDALRRAFEQHLKQAPLLTDRPAREVHAKLQEFARSEMKEGRLKLTPDAPTPIGWALTHVCQIFLLAALIVGGILTLPLTLVPLLLLAWRLRSIETSDPEIVPRPDREWVSRLAELEDYGVTNQFSAMGSLKPGLFRRLLLTLILWVINLTTHLIYTKGRLARVHTIHFARWVYLDNKTRLLFCSNYDGSLESYMDDFINKVAFGLNAVFSNGIGYPRTRWLILDGAKNEQAFKYFIRRHELPTEVWYNAHAGLTTHDLERNSRIRKGIEATSMTDRELAEWVALL